MGYHYSNGKRYEFWLGILLKARCRASRLAWKHTAEALMFQNFTLFNCGQILFTIIKKTSFWKPFFAYTRIFKILAIAKKRRTLWHVIRRFKSVETLAVFPKFLWVGETGGKWKRGLSWTVCFYNEKLVKIFFKFWSRFLQLKLK